MRKILFSLAALALVATACNKASTPASSSASLTVGNVPATVKGDVVTIPVTVKGIKIVKPDGDVSGKTGHFHVFIDRRPLKPGATIPKMKGIVHTFENPIKLYGLTPGAHKIHIVLGNGSHIRIDPKARATVKVNVDGPSVQGTIPSPTATKGKDVVVSLKAEGVTIGDGAGNGHFHVLVDPMAPPKAGDTLEMSGKGMYMTDSATQTLSGLTAGEHVIWVVLATADHKAWDPPVMDKLAVTVS